MSETEKRVTKTKTVAATAPKASEHALALEIIRDRINGNTTKDFRDRRDIIDRVLAGGPAVVED